MNSTESKFERQQFYDDLEATLGAQYTQEYIIILFYEFKGRNKVIITLNLKMKLMINLW